VRQLFARLPDISSANATLIVYGPFNYGGRYSCDSNAEFDRWLQQRGSHMAIRDAAAVDVLASGAGFNLIDDVAMPANNRCRIWRRTCS
jgi:hypothetical protein